MELAKVLVTKGQVLETLPTITIRLLPGDGGLGRVLLGEGSASHKLAVGGGEAAPLLDLLPLPGQGRHWGRHSL